MQVAAELLEVLPPELASLGAPEERATEYAHYRQFFAIWAAFERVLACQAREGAQEEGPRERLVLLRRRVAQLEGRAPCPPLDGLFRAEKERLGMIGEEALVKAVEQDHQLIP